RRRACSAATDAVRLAQHWPAGAVALRQSEAVGMDGDEVGEAWHVVSTEKAASLEAARAWRPVARPVERAKPGLQTSPRVRLPQKPATTANPRRSRPQACPQCLPRGVEAAGSLIP